MSDIIALQEKVAHQEVEISRLSEELYTQQREILALRRQVERLENTMKSGGFIRTQEEETPPPHY